MSEIKNKYLHPGYIIITAIIMGCIIWFTIHAFSGKTEPVNAPASEAKTAFTVDNGLAAVERAAGSDKVCYSKVQNGWLMHWTKKSDNTDTNARDGWYMMTNVSFKELDNGTLYIEDINSIKDWKIDPDITGLACKIRIEEATK